MAQSPTQHDTGVPNVSSTQSPLPKGKRVKTGCLTCRKRRVKCDEKKPICSNCTKSKRFCEGYHQRPSLREPPSGMGIREAAFPKRSLSLHHRHDIYPPFFNGGVPGQRIIAPTPTQGTTCYPSGVASPGSAPLSVSPVPIYDPAFFNAPTYPQSAGYPSKFLSGLPHAGEDDSSQSGSIQRHVSISGPCNGPWATPLPTGHDFHRPLLASTLSPHNASVAASSPHMVEDALPSVNQVSPPQFTGDVISSVHQPSPSRSIGNFITSTGHSPPPPYSSHIVTTAASDFSHAATQSVYGYQHLPPDIPSHLEGNNTIDVANWNSANVGEFNHGEFKIEPIEVQYEAPRRKDPNLLTRRRARSQKPAPSALPSRMDADDEQDEEDDPYDEEAVEHDKDCIHPSEQSKKDLGNMLITHVSSDRGRPSRSFTTFLDKRNILAAYRPSHAALPQADEKAARIFCHFVSSTGPCMSIFERPSTEAPEIPGISAVSGFQQPLWTYTLPSLALNHPPLMHAMLALAALHISKLQQTSPGPSMKHFAYALRRVGRQIGLPQQRNEVTTFAATMLLGYYEIMSAETSKWNIHLAGAKVLAMEIDFAGKTRKIRALRAQMKKLLTRLRPEIHVTFLQDSGVPKSLIADHEWDVDEDLISAFTGYTVRYDHQYQGDIRQQTYQNVSFTARDVELYKMQADLYWWYCKQDIFQSMLSGDRLLMPYEHWVFCPPRGRMAQPDLVFAAMDHLCLILARLADFGGKDQARKRRAAGRARTPRASGPMGPPPAAGKGPPVGYMPASDQPQPMHSAFVTMNENLHNTAFRQEVFSPHVAELPQSNAMKDLDAETDCALAEHSAITQALDLFALSLPTGYEPLPRSAAPPISTPFGPALQYRTHTIACLWTLYYSGRILHARLHPSMPPAAMISAQVAAARTAEYSQTIGKICAGLYYPQQYSLRAGSLHPSLGGAMIESTFSLFFAAVQFTNPAQRGWTINKLQEIASLSGWQTAAAIAAGCEFAWQAMGQAGRGPPYKPTMDWRNKDERVGDKALKASAKAAAERGISKQAQSEGEDQNPSMEQGGSTPGRARTGSQQTSSSLSGSGRGGPQLNAEPTNGEKRNNDEGENQTRPGVSHDSISHDREAIGTNSHARTHWAMGLLSLEEDVAKIHLDD